MQLDRFFEALWFDFVRIAPQAAAIKARLEELGERVENDHVAFRTFDRSPVDLATLEPRLLELGYQPLEDYAFPDKHLRARAYTRQGAPRIFLSELLRAELSTGAQTLLQRCVDAIPHGAGGSAQIFHQGRLWPALPFADYERLASESEYAGWLCALGLRPNHFTVSLNAMQKLRTVEAILEFVERAGYKVNAAGGRVKGSATIGLEQGSTLADRVAVDFADGTHTVPTCYYEFALRHRIAGGELYPGFVTDSASRIFESTDRAAR
jgi:hypothetical protein